MIRKDIREMKYQVRTSIEDISNRLDCMKEEAFSVETCGYKVRMQLCELIVIDVISSLGIVTPKGWGEICN